MCTEQPKSACRIYTRKTINAGICPRKHKKGGEKRPAPGISPHLPRCRGEQQNTCDVCDPNPPPGLTLQQNRDRTDRARNECYCHARSAHEHGREGESASPLVRKSQCCECQTDEGPRGVFPVSRGPILQE